MYPGASLWLLLPSVLLTLSPCRAADPGSWGDWVILDEAEPGTSILLRRITPKSVFVAPTLSCSEGYRQDALGRCIKHVKVNQAEQWKFYLDRLNSMYAPATSSKKPQKEAGPFHISLPIGSDKSQEDVVVKKRLPPVFRDPIVKIPTPSTTTTTQAPTTTQPPPTTTTYPPPTTMPTPATTVQESTTPEAAELTGLDTTEATTSAEREFNFQPEMTTESRTTELEESAVMLGDQPVSGENSTAETEPPKNPSQSTDKPFVIIVTSEPASMTEESAFVPVTAFTPPTTEREDEEVTGEAVSTTEVTSETTPRYTTDSTEYDERFSEMRDTTSETQRLTTTSRPPCAADYDDCGQADTEVVSHKRVVSYPSNMPLLEHHTRVRFPSDSYPVRKSQQSPQSQFVRFPEMSHPRDDRPGLWWPTWQVGSHPAIRGWPPPESNDPVDILHKQYPPYPQPALSWSNSPPSSTAWRRRHYQRD